MKNYHLSRSQETENNSSDLDVVLEYAGLEREDSAFNLLHDESITIGNAVIDINPIRECESGMFGEYLKSADTYLEIKAKSSKRSIKGNFRK